jgi:hypothetical protein
MVSGGNWGCSACLWKSIEVSIDVRTPDEGAKDDIGGNGGVGRAIAAVAERYPAVRHSGDFSNDGYLPIDKHGADLLFQIISQRYERAPMVITTNRAYKHWSQINNEPTLS